MSATERELRRMLAELAREYQEDGGKLELVKEMTPEEFTAAQDNGRAWPQADNE